MKRSKRLIVWISTIIVLGMLRSFGNVTAFAASGSPESGNASAAESSDAVDRLAAPKKQEDYSGKFICTTISFGKDIFLCRKRSLIRS